LIEVTQRVLSKELSRKWFLKIESRPYKIKPKTNKKILPFVMQYHPAVPNVKQILMKHWHLIEEQPLLKEIFKEPPLMSYKKGGSLKDILVRSKL